MAEPAFAPRRPSSPTPVEPARAPPGAPSHEALERRFALHADRASVLDGRPAARAERDKAALLAARADRGPRPIQRKAEMPNRTGMPDRLRSGVEALSGLSMGDVRVHYGSSRPAALQARAFTAGTDIHVGPGQERYLPHEAWHVVQQKQGRVRATAQAAGAAINDDPGLESEADAMGAAALGFTPAAASDAAHARPARASRILQRAVVQRYWFEADSGVMWIPGDPMEDMEQTGADHAAEDEHASGPIWRLKADEPAREDELEAHAADQQAQPLHLAEPVWEEDGEGVDQVSVKDAGTDVPSLVGPTAAWGGEGDFGALGWDEPVSQVRVDRPVYPQVHVSFWCKVGDVDVKIHLTKSGYSLIYNAQGAPGENDLDVSQEGLTGKDLYTEFLRIARVAGGYREGANECQTFAGNMLGSLKKAEENAKAD
jgi:hypothetical protein